MAGRGTWVSNRTPHQVTVLIQLTGDDMPVAVGTAVGSADVPLLLREIARLWESGRRPAAVSAGS